MNLSKLTLASLASATAVLFSVNPVIASQVADFSSCLTPAGSVVANFDNGEHGIAGLGTKIGKDTVYSLANGNAMQCFCGTDGSGIQTNWLFAGQLSEGEIKIYENEGWIFIPDGSAWGLSEGAYLAKNINYSCGGSSTANSGGDGRTDGRSDGLGSIVQAAKGSNLASTGNILFITEVLTAGVVMTLAGLFMRNKVS